MACEGNGLSDERIAEDLIKEVIKVELKEVSTEDVPSLSQLGSQTQSAQEKMVVDQLGKMVKIVGDKLQDDVEFKQLIDAIDGFSRVPGSKLDHFKQVAYNVFEDGITWERIFVLFFAAGQLAVRVVEAHLPQSVWEIVHWIVDFFRHHLLGWIRNHGGWINSFSELATAPIRAVSGGQAYGVLLFVAGLTVGCLVTWRLLQRQ